MFWSFSRGHNTLTTAEQPVQQIQKNNITLKKNTLNNRHLKGITEELHNPKEISSLILF